MAATIAVVIPVWGDKAPLARLLERIAAWRDPDLEIVVVAGDDDPDTARVTAKAGGRYLSSQPCRGRQLDLGARATTAAILWFLHADALPAAAACAEIRRTVAAGAVGGYLRFRFQGTPNPGKRLLAAAINLRARFGVPYGDQGLFATREAYGHTGGFPHQPLFEEVAVVKSLRRQGPVVALPLPIAVDPRRWERDGWLKRTLRNRWLALRYACGARPIQLAASYQRQERSHG
jgi:rSAM/selenodomain-associated transferase 2